MMRIQHYKVNRIMLNSVCTFIFKAFKCCLMLILKNNISPTRISKKLSTADVAKRIGCAQSQITRLETGETQLTMDWINKIAVAMNCSPLELIIDIEEVAQHLNRSLLTKVINIIETEIKTNNIRLSIENKSKAISALYQKGVVKKLFTEESLLPEKDNIIDILSN